MTRLARKPHAALLAAAVLLLVGLVVLVLARGWHGWEWPGWEAMVALGTLALAIGTGYLARSTGLHAEQTAAEVAAAQTPVVVEDGAAGLRLHVRPEHDRVMALGV